VVSDIKACGVIFPNGFIGCKVRIQNEATQGNFFIPVGLQKVAGYYFPNGEG